jgi:hypothetical protein
MPQAPNTEVLDEHLKEVVNALQQARRALPSTTQSDQAIGVKNLDDDGEHIGLAGIVSAGITTNRRPEALGAVSAVPGKGLAASGGRRLTMNIIVCGSYRPAPSPSRLIHPANAWSARYS